MSLIGLQLMLKEKKNAKNRKSQLDEIDGIGEVLKKDYYLILKV